MSPLIALISVLVFARFCANDAETLEGTMILEMCSISPASHDGFNAFVSNSHLVGCSPEPKEICANRAALWLRDNSVSGRLGNLVRAS
jgi:hypothetical protein